MLKAFLKTQLTWTFDIQDLIWSQLPIKIKLKTTGACDVNLEWMHAMIWDLGSGCCCLQYEYKHPNIVNVLYKLRTMKRTGTGCPVQSLMVSVLLLLWMLAACRGLWRRRYVELNSSHWTCSLFSCWLGTFHTCIIVFLIFLEEKGRINQFGLVCASGDQCDLEERVEGFINTESWLRAAPLICASSLFCMIVSCQGRREIKMVVCISCWVHVALPVFSLPMLSVSILFFYSRFLQENKMLITHIPIPVMSLPQKRLTVTVTNTKSLVVTSVHWCTVCSVNVTIKGFYVLIYDTAYWSWFALFKSYCFDLHTNAQKNNRKVR